MLAQSLAGYTSTNTGAESNGVCGNGNHADAEAAGEHRHDLYKRLITGALGVKVEDVETLLPEMLRELEDAREEASGRNGFGNVGDAVAVAGSGPAVNGHDTHMHMQQMQMQAQIQGQGQGQAMGGVQVAG